MRLFELIDTKLNPCIDFVSNVTMRGIGFLPKRCVDVQKTELAKAIKLTDSSIEFISFRQPVKIEGFKEEYFPECISETPAL